MPDAQSSARVGSTASRAAGRAGCAERWASRIERTLDAAALVMLAVMAAATCYQVFGRYVLGRAPAWSEELARYLMVWLTFLGAAAVLRSGGHLTVTALLDRLGPRGVAIVLAVRDVILVGLCLVLAWAALRFALLNAAQDSAAMDIPMLIPNGALAIGFLLIAVQTVLARMAGAPFPALAGDQF